MDEYKIETRTDLRTGTCPKSECGGPLHPQIADGKHWEGDRCGTCNASWCFQWPGTLAEAEARSRELSVTHA